MLQNSTLVNNQALINPNTGIGSGGALRLNHGGGRAKATITNVVFANNVADQEGGALWAGGSGATLDLAMTRVTF